MAQRRAAFIANLREAEIQLNAQRLLASVGLKLLGTKVRIGAYEIDAIGCDAGGLVVVEFKANRATGSLGQVIIYMQAVHYILSKSGVQSNVRGLLATTYLDDGVLDVVRRLPAAISIDVRVISGSSTDDLVLVAPSAASRDVCGHQAARGSSSIGVVDGKLRIRNTSVDEIVLRSLV